MKQSLYFVLLILGLLHVCIDSALGAQIKFIPTKDGAWPGGTIEITGEIVSGDADKLRQYISLYETHNAQFKGYIFGEDDRLNVLLESRGGNLHEGIIMGRLLRTFPTITVATDGGCISACVLVWLGGNTRLGSSKTLFIHRPWFNEERTAVSELSGARQSYQDSVNDLRRYIAEVTNSEDLFRSMMSIENSNVQPVPADVVLSLMNSKDPFNDELYQRRNKERFGEENFSSYKKCGTSGEEQIEQWLSRVMVGRGSIDGSELQRRTSEIMNRCRQALFAGARVRDDRNTSQRSR